MHTEGRVLSCSRTVLQCAATGPPQRQARRARVRTGARWRTCGAVEGKTGGGILSASGRTIVVLVLSSKTGLAPPTAAVVTVACRGRGVCSRQSRTVGAEEVALLRHYRTAVYPMAPVSWEEQAVPLHRQGGASLCDETQIIMLICFTFFGCREVGGLYHCARVDATARLCKSHI